MTCWRESVWGTGQDPHVLGHAPTAAASPAQHLGAGLPCPGLPSHLSRKKSALWLKDALKYVQFSTRSQERHCLLKVPTVLALEEQRQRAVSPADKVQTPSLAPGLPARSGVPDTAPARWASCVPLPECPGTLFSVPPSCRVGPQLRRARGTSALHRHAFQCAFGHLCVYQAHVPQCEGGTVLGALI